MKNITKYSALVSTILLTSALAGPVNAEAPSTAQLEKVPTQTSQLTAVKAEKTSQIKFEKPTVRTTPADVAVEPVAAPVAPQAVSVESTPTAPSKPVETAPSPAPVAPSVAPAPEKKVAPPVASASGKGATIAAAAYAQIGVSQDCTALATNALAAAGINFHGWPAGYLSLGRTVSAAEAQAGDLAYYENGGMGMAHIAVYVGNGMAVHGGWNGGTTALYSVNVGSGPVFIRVA
jgi:cell wall-associated NlpC family hydrolase